MPTLWTTPTTVTQYKEYEDHIDWTNISAVSFPDTNSARTVKPLLHIAVSRDNNIKMKTAYLKCTGFNFTFVPNPILGIELKVDINRTGRITDNVIQLTLNNEPIGENSADLNRFVSAYGGETDLWGTSLSSELINSTFGVILRYQSHPYFPHNCSPYIESVQLRLW